MNKNQLFPEKGTVFDYICDKRNNQWVFWIDIVDREHSKISSSAKVSDNNKKTLSQDGSEASNILISDFWTNESHLVH